MENGWIIGMQPPAATVPSWVSWYRHVRPEHRPPARASPRARPSSFALYFNSRNEPIRVDRIDGLLYPKLPTLPPLGKAWATGAPWAPRVPFDMFELAVPFDHAAWRRPAQPPDIITEITLNHHQLSPAGVGGGGAGGGGWSLAARGWAAGAALLVLLALVVRAAERCIDSKLFKVRRRDSEEWPTATVMATSVQNDNMEAGLPRLDDAFTSPSAALDDLPPPYSECAANMLANKRELTEEPPPPYSACYVSFTNPKRGPPSVHIHARPADRRPRTSAEADSQHDVPNTDASTYNDIIDDEIRTELVFENGRVVERVSLNPNINTLEVSIDNVLENRNININSVVSDATNTTNNEPAQSNGNNTTEREIMV